LSARVRRGAAIIAAALALAVVPTARAQNPLANPACAALEPNPITHVEGPASASYALTFDEPLGPDTPRILRILRRHDARATFFVVGNEARDHPRLVRAIVRRGHELANHTFTHPYLADLSPSERRRELLRTQRVIHRIAGVTPCYMRPPANSYNRAVVRQASRLGLGTVLWSHAAAEVGNGAEGVTAALVAEVRPGSIVVFHQVPIAVWALPETLQGLAERGLRAVTVRNLLRDH
jgi:peptidoglycan-N-acetylglucosamine deacetylase